MYGIQKTSVFLVLVLFISIGWSAPLPANQHSNNGLYMGVGLGYSWSDYSRNDFPTINVIKLTNRDFGQQFRIGYLFNGGYGLEVGVLYANHPEVLYQIRVKGISHPFRLDPMFWHHLIYLNAQYSIPVGSSFYLNVQGGIGYIARRTVESWLKEYLPGGNYVAATYGLGLSYRLSNNWFLVANWLGATGNVHFHLPPTNILTVGLNYRLQPLFKAIKSNPTRNRKEVFVGFYNSKFYKPKLKRPPAPIAWYASTKVDNGVTAGYLYQFFEKHFIAMYGGLAIAEWQRNQAKILAFSAFIETRLLFFQLGPVRPYIAYNIAGPTLLSSSRFDGVYLGAPFTWEDYLGVGVEIGQWHQLDIAAHLQHYSNGDIFARNPGFNVPIVFTIGFRF